MKRIYKTNGKLIYATFLAYVVLVTGAYQFAQIRADRPAGPATTYILRHNNGYLPKLTTSNQQVLGPPITLTK